MRRPILHFTLLALLLPCDARSEGLRIGVVTNLSGIHAERGVMTQAGARLTGDQLKHDGHDVEVLVEDGMSDAKQSLSAGRRLLDLDKVDALYIDTAIFGAALSPILKEKKKLFFYLGGHDSLVRENPYAFKSLLDFQDGCRVLAEHWKRQGLRKVAIVKVDMESSELCIQGLLSVFSDTIIKGQESISDDPSAAVLAAKNQGAQAITSFAFEIGLLNQLRATQNYQFTVPVGTLEVNIGKTVRALDPALLKRLIVAGMPSATPDVDASLERYGVPPGDTLREYAVLAYLHLTQIAKALEACPRNDIACQAQKLSMEPPDKRFGFQGFKDRYAQFPITLRQWKDGDFVELPSH